MWGTTWVRQTRRGNLLLTVRVHWNIHSHVRFIMSISWRKTVPVWLSPVYQQWTYHSLTLSHKCNIAPQHLLCKILMSTFYFIFYKFFKILRYKISFHIIHPQCNSACFDILPHCRQGPECIDGLVQYCSISSALAVEIVQSCTRPSIFYIQCHGCSWPGDIGGRTSAAKVLT